MIQQGERTGRYYGSRHENEIFKDSAAVFISLLN